MAISPCHAAAGAEPFRLARLFPGCHCDDRRSMGMRIVHGFRSPVRPRESPPDTERFPGMTGSLRATPCIVRHGSVRGLQQPRGSTRNLFCGTCACRADQQPDPLRQHARWSRAASCAAMGWNGQVAPAGAGRLERGARPRRFPRAWGAEAAPMCSTPPRSCRPQCERD